MAATPERVERSPIAYRALADDLRAALSKGEFNGGRRLPTEAELTAEYGVSRQTVRRALQELVSEGVVHRVRGRGTFSTAGPPRGQYLRSFGSIDDLLSISEDTVLEVVAPFERLVDVEAAGRLQLASDELYRGTFRRLHSDAPFFITNVYVSVEMGRLLAGAALPTHPGVTIVSLINRLVPHEIVGAHQSITAHAMPAALAPLIDLQPGEPALRIDRVFFDSESRGLELAVSYANPARYTHRVELRRSSTREDR